MTKASLAALAGLALILSSGPARAQEEEVFISLTRTAERADRMPTSVSVITAEEIERSGAVTLADALNALPSVDVQETAVPGQFSSVRLRGVPASNQVQVVVDDQPLGGVFLQDLDIGLIPAGDIERIEVVRGGASALYGANTIGGVIHIITKKARTGGALTSLGYETRSFDTHIQKAGVRLPGKSLDGTVDVLRYRTGGFQENSDGDSLNVSGSLGYALANGGRIALEGSRWDTQAGLPDGTPVPYDQWNGRRERTPSAPEARVDQGMTLGRARLTLPAGAATVQSVTYGSNQDYLFENPLFAFRSEIDKNVIGNDTRLLLPGKWTVGGSYERDEYRSKGTAKLHGTNWGLYLQKVLTAGPVDFYPAFRFDQNGAFGNAYNPRLSAVVRVTEKVKLSAGAGRSMRAPTLVNLFQDFPDDDPTFPDFTFFGNPSLQPETAWSYDAGFSVRPTEDSSVSVTGFHTRIKNRIAAVDLDGVLFFGFPDDETNINAPRAETTGVEAEASGTWGPVRHRLSYTYQRAVGNSVTSSEYLPIRFTPRHIAGAEATWHAPKRWDLTAGVRYAAEQFSSDGLKGTKIPSHTVWNARVAKTILGAELFFKGENLGNRHYADSLGQGGALLPQPGRTYWAGMTLRFKD